MNYYVYYLNLPLSHGIEDIFIYYIHVGTLLSIHLPIYIEKLINA